MSNRLDSCPTCGKSKDSRAKQCDPCSRKLPRKTGNRWLAHQKGLTHYLCEKPCKKCGHFERYTSSAGCTTCTRAAKVTPTRKPPEACECCGGPTNGNGRLHLDHDHETGTFRGWLCSNCNTGIGKLGDSVEGLKAALHYLENCH